MALNTNINLHPNDHLPSSLASTTYDVIYIGSGWSANVSASRLIKAGLSAVMVESELFGGDCPFWACIPSKALLRPGEAFQEAAGVGGVRQRLDISKGLDVGGVLERRNAWTANWQDDKMITPVYEGFGATLVRGQGRLTGVKTVEVTNSTGGSVTLHARQAVVVCTGSYASIPDIPGLVDAKPWTPREVTSANSIPNHLVVLGAGAVGCEMASAYSQFGKKVSLICSASEILPKVDQEAGAIVRKRFEKQGVDVYLSTTVTKVQRDASGVVTIHVDGKQPIMADEILVAVGRKSRTEALGLEPFDIKVDGSPIPVEEDLSVASVPGHWLYAAGDVNGRALLSHTSKYHGRILADDIIARLNGHAKAPSAWASNAATADQVAVPQVVFTLPEIASVGLTRKAAAKSGRKVREVTSMARTEGAELRMDGYEDGWAQWIVDETSNKLLGATFVGDNVTDLLHASTVAIVGGLTLDRIAHAIPAFPTMSEVYLNLLEAAGY
ncbi:MAG: Dihydrolipoyl dehydrogenase [Chrysothrix sp. TS-e1954]|nr:MAG: Dihydrolipoyl dehydrogenase [Chrysothrix sp. TS-e1954]